MAEEEPVTPSVTATSKEIKKSPMVLLQTAKTTEIHPVNGKQSVFCWTMEVSGVM